MTTPESTELPVFDPVEHAKWEGGQRLWLKTITDLMRTMDSHSTAHPDKTVQTSLDRMYSAAAERAARILRHDMMG